MARDDKTLAVIAKILADVAQVDPTRVTRDSDLRDGFAIDSLSMIDVVVAVEDQFGVRIPDEDAERFHTVGDLVDFLDRSKVAAA